MVVAAAAFSFASCSSEKDCECQVLFNGQVMATETETVDFGDMDDADDCEDLNESESTMGITSEVKCEEV